MKDFAVEKHQILYVSNFHDLVCTPFHGEKNAICWTRKLKGDFSEIVKKIELNGNLMVLDPEELLELQLSDQGQLAREVLLSDLKNLEDHGASPTLNLIQSYDKDNTHPFFPTDVYSFHVDRSPVASDTFLCTYHGESSEIIPNSQAEQKVGVPEIRNELKKHFSGSAEAFEMYLTEYFFDLHYQAKPEANPIQLGIGNLWRLATEYPGSPVPPCIHRAPKETSGQIRLLLIC
jgi:hypothetical protein